MSVGLPGRLVSHGRAMTWEQAARILTNLTQYQLLGFKVFTIKLHLSGLYTNIPGTNHVQFITSLNKTFKILAASDTTVL